MVQRRKYGVSFPWIAIVGKALQSAAMGSKQGNGGAPTGTSLVVTMILIPSSEVLTAVVDLASE